MLAEEFQRFDMIESVEKGINFELFIDAFSSLCRLDFAFSEYTKCQETGLFKDGKDIFGSLPVCVGFMVACAEYVMGKISVEREEDVKKEKNIKMTSQINAIIALLNKNRDNKDFLALDTLNEIVASASNSASRIGDEMRTLFKTVFFEMLKYEDLDELTSFQAFWRS